MSEYYTMPQLIQSVRTHGAREGVQLDGHDLTAAWELLSYYSEQLFRLRRELERDRVSLDGAQSRINRLTLELDCLKHDKPSKTKQRLRDLEVRVALLEAGDDGK